MPIELIRVDDRLIHGQVVTQWLPYTNANRIIIIDDGVAADAFLSSISKGFAPAGVEVHILNAAEAAQQLKGLTEAPDVKALVLVKSPLPILELVQAGTDIDVLTIGGMGMREGRQQLYRNISADESERQAISRLMELGVAVKCHIVPGEAAVDAQKLL